MRRISLLRSNSWLACLFALAGFGCQAGDEGDDEVAETGESETESETGSDSGSESESETGETGIEPVVDWPTLDCDPLVPEYCAFPFPNNVFSEADPSTPTGRRLALSAELLPKTDYSPMPDPWNEADGFSPAATMMAFLPGATVEGLPTPITIEASLEPDSPTIVFDAETGERVAHFAELDMSHDDPDRRAFMIKPVVGLEPDRRYIVAIRGVVDGSGTAIAASEAFAALRDDLASDEPSVEARRPLYADIFARLEDAGVARADLQLAWDFTTASTVDTTGRLIHMRDEGLALLGEGPGDGPDYEITSVEMDPAPGVAMRLEILMTVPLYLDDPGPGGNMLFGPDGLPEPSGTAQYPVLVHIPSSAVDEPAKPVAYGHGLLGSRYEINAEHLLNFCAEGNTVVFATDWIGMSEDDTTNIATLLAAGRIDDFSTVTDRLQQGLFNAMAAMRLIRGPLVDDPLLQGPNGSMIDPSEGWYFGGSQGGIFGATYMAITTDVERGVLAVPGQPYNLLLNRSVDFVDFFTLLKGSYPDGIDLRFLLELTQLLWDRVEPSGFSRHIIDDPLPGTPPHEVLTLVSIGDHQVTTLGAHVMAREIGIPQIKPVNRGLWGIDEVDQPYQGSAMIEYDWGLPPEPIQNVPMTEGDDPHGALAGSAEAAMTVEQFLRTGVVETFCDGVCDPG
ncbi:hypothetical protein ACNOYE_30665 [Nannocystaceae bacterium ST9]